MGQRPPRELLDELRTYLQHFDQTGHFGESGHLGDSETVQKSSIAFASVSPKLKLNSEPRDRARTH